MSLDLTDRRIYGFATEEHLRFADVDANGHINNGAFLQLLENARVSYMRAIVRSGLPRFRVVVGRLERHAAMGLLVQRHHDRLEHGLSLIHI